MEHEIVDMAHASKFDKTYKYFKTKNEMRFTPLCRTNFFHCCFNMSVISNRKLLDNVNC